MINEIAMNFKDFNSHLFKIISFIPIIWISSLYLFVITCIIELGHFPTPSINDPKEIGLSFLYTLIGIGMFALIFGSILWLINLSIAIYLKRVSKKHLIIFSIGIVICLIQIFYDPGQLIYWYMD